MYYIWIVSQATTSFFHSSFIMKRSVTKILCKWQYKKDKETIEACEHVKEAANAVKEGAKVVKKTSEYVKDTAASTAENVRTLLHPCITYCLRA